MPVSPTPITNLQATIDPTLLLSAPGLNPNPHPKNRPAASNAALVRELRGIVTVRQDLDVLREQEKKQLEAVIFTLEQRLKAVEEGRAREMRGRRELFLHVKGFKDEVWKRVEAREERQKSEAEKRLMEMWLVLEEREGQLEGIKRDLEKERKDGLKMRRELEVTRAVLGEVVREEKAKQNPSGAVAAFLWLVMLVEMFIDFMLKHFVDGIFEAAGPLIVILGFVLVYTW